MKALSLMQPWATLVVTGAKLFETRSWQTAHRGPLLIHAAKSWTTTQQHLCTVDPFRSALRLVGYELSDELPRGAVIGQVDISVDVRDGYQGRSAGGAEQAPANADTVYVPDKTGTPFDVVMVVRMGQGTPLDHLQVYLHRGVPPWPTTAL